jgi:pilus assembly protein CpaE
VNHKNSVKKTLLRIDLVGDTPDFREEAKQALSRVAEPPLEVIESDLNLESSAFEGVGPDLSDVSMVLFNGNEEQSLAFLQNRAAQTPRPALFALLKDPSPVLMKRVIRAGADELLFLPLDTGELTRALLTVSEARFSAGRHEGGTVVSLTSIVGGVGVTTMAANLALAIRYHLGKRVALMDLDLQTGVAAVLLNLEPEFTIMPLIRLEKKLDSIQLEAALTKHSSGLYLLAAPKRIEEGEQVSDATVGAVIDCMRKMFDYVIVDCGNHVDENSVAAWERSNQLLYVLNQSVISVRSAWRFIDLYERLQVGGLDPQYAVNRFVANHTVTIKQLESTLGHPMYVTIPRDEKSLELAELSGKDLWQVAPGSPIVKSFEALGSRTANVIEPEVAPERPLMSRLFSAFSAHS